MRRKKSGADIGQPGIIHAISTQNYAVGVRRERCRKLGAGQSDGADNAAYNRPVSRTRPWRWRAKLKRMAYRWRCAIRRKRRANKGATGRTTERDGETKAITCNAGWVLQGLAKAPVVTVRCGVQQIRPAACSGAYARGTGRTD